MSRTLGRQRSYDGGNDRDDGADHLGRCVKPIPDVGTVIVVSHCECPNAPKRAGRCSVVSSTRASQSGIAPRRTQQEGGGAPGCPRLPLRPTVAAAGSARGELADALDGEVAGATDERRPPTAA